MKRVILTITALVIAVAVPMSVAAADTLSKETRARIERDLLRELAPRVGVFDYISFQVDGNGNVALFGQVRDATLKKHAAEDAKRVEGVRRVQNQIEILPVSPTDDEIRRAVYTAIYSQNGFERYRIRAVPPVHIIVKNGSVALEGVVGTKLELAQVKTAANSVPGVFSVKNNVHIESSN